MISEFLDAASFAALIHATVVSSAMLVLVLLLRRPLRDGVGAHLSYQLWLLVPASLAALLLPGAPHSSVTTFMPVTAMRLTASAVGTVQAGAWSWHSWALLAWFGGVVFAALWFALTHVSLMRMLGRLCRQDGHYVSQSIRIGPALIGLWRPKIVVPADFHQRYSESEQTLILAHEAAHRQRRDPIANISCAILQCLFWFNPLVQLAAQRFRFDQELACDALVMRRSPAGRRDYAAALLKTSASGIGALVSCSWQSQHPLKERIMNLNQTSPRRALKIGGQLLLATLLGLTAYGVSATNAAEPQASAKATVVYRVAMGIKLNGQLYEPVIEANADEEMTVKFTDNAGHPFDATVVIHSLDDKRVKISSVIKRGALPVSKPSLIVDLGQKAAVAQSDPDPKNAYGFEIVATLAGKTAPAAAAQ